MFINLILSLLFFQISFSQEDFKEDLDLEDLESSKFDFKKTEDLNDSYFQSPVSRIDMIIKNID